MEPHFAQLLLDALSRLQGKAESNGETIAELKTAQGEHARQLERLFDLVAQLEETCRARGSCREPRISRTAIAALVAALTALAAAAVKAFGGG